MSRKPKAEPAELPASPAERLEPFGNGSMTAEIIGAATLALRKALIERALGGEMNHHRGYSPGAAKPPEMSPQRNGKGTQTVLAENGPIHIEVPRDRDGSFQPRLILKHQRRFPGRCQRPRGSMSASDAPLKKTRISVRMSEATSQPEPQEPRQVSSRSHPHERGRLRARQARQHRAPFQSPAHRLEARRSRAHPGATACL